MRARLYVLHFLLILLALSPPTSIDIKYINNAEHRVGNALADYTDMSSEESFNCVFGVVVFEERDYLYGYDSYTYPDKTVAYISGRVKIKLMVHELGHVFDLLIPYKQRPTTLLATRGIVDRTGDKVTGSWYNGYYRHIGKTAPANGYLSDSYLLGYQMHPVYMQGGNSATEDWADIFLNWVYQSFASNDAGDAINAWVDKNMRIWLRRCMR